MQTHPRREFLAGLAALGVSAAFPGAAAGRTDQPSRFVLRRPAEAVAEAEGRPRGTQTAPRAMPHRIDVHCHFSAPGFIAAIKARNTGQRALMEWTPSQTLEDMDRDGVATSIVSTSEPNVWFGDNTGARALARECNEYGARLMADYPRRFGMFATLPLPDVEGALREIEYAFDTLKADGACFMTSYQGRYLGDPAFAPVMDELNRRRAVVYTHPVRADCCINLLPENRALGVTLATDTTFTILSVLTSGTAKRCPDIRFIWSHGGGTMPYITGRFPAGSLAEIQRMYYDTAQAFNPYTLPTFTKVVPMSHILFGTDYPFARGETVAKGLAAFGFSASDVRAIERDNALALFPRYGSG
jgi:predicted TIM-barrel fold metal-dependent hydrolase